MGGREGGKINEENFTYLKRTNETGNITREFLSITLTSRTRNDGNAARALRPKR